MMRKGPRKNNCVSTEGAPEPQRVGARREFAGRKRPTSNDECGAPARPNAAVILTRALKRLLEVPHDHDDHGGLARDLLQMNALLSRRRALRWIGGGAAVTLVGCATQSLGGDASSTPDSGGSCSEIPDETGGPYPGDGSNGPNVLGVDGIVRSDIRSSIGGATGVAAGVPLSITLTLLDTACVPLAGYAIYLWHCDQGGNYSMYSASVAEENYLRGVQETDAAGQVTFSTIFPACYSGRWPHMHFEIFSALDAATIQSNAIKTTQLALPEAACHEVFATSGYEASVANLAAISLASDNVFRDGSASQVASIVGNASSGYSASLVASVRL